MGEDREDGINEECRKFSFRDAVLGSNFDIEMNEGDNMEEGMFLTMMKSTGMRMDPSSQWDQGG